MAQIQVGLRLDRELFERVNEARGPVPRNRWIIRTLEAALGRVDGGSAGHVAAERSAGRSDQPGVVPAPPRASVPSRVSTEVSKACPSCDEPMAARVDPKAGGLWVCPSCGTREKRTGEK